MSRCAHPVLVLLRRSLKKDKKYDAVIGKKTVSFGQRGASDYTIHKDPDRMARYVTRHEKREKWDVERGLKTAGFWSRWLLWNKPSLARAKKDMEAKFCLRIQQERRRP